MRRFITAILASSMLLLATASGALAAKPAPVGHLHEHSMTTPGGTHEVGPPRCDNAATAQGFYAFHRKVHQGPANQQAFASENTPVEPLVVVNC